MFRLMALASVLLTQRSRARCARLVVASLASVMLMAPLASAAAAHGLGRHAPSTPNAPSAPTRSQYDTGQTSKAKPVLTFCNGHTYLAWAAADNSARLYIAIGTSPSSFTNVVAFNEYLYRYITTDIQRSTGPALICWNGRVYVAFTGTDTRLNVGYFDGNAAHNYLNAKTTLSQYTYRSPALAASSDGWLNLAWTGTNNKLNVIRSGNATSWGAVHTWGETATGGPGFTNYCYSGSCNLYIFWFGTDFAVQGNIGYFRTSDGTFHFLQSLGNSYRINSHPNYDASLAVKGSALYTGFEAGNVSAAKTTNPGGSWAMTVDPTTENGPYGVGAAYDPVTAELYFTFITGLTPLSNPTEVTIRAAHEILI
jgi:hypothetical protein